MGEASDRLVVMVKEDEDEEEEEMRSKGGSPWTSHQRVHLLSTVNLGILF